MNLLNIIEVVFAFCFMVAIHEWGHFLAMRLLGVGVEEYCIGFPPRIASKKWGNTLYSVGAIPLGGFCKPQGGDLSGQSAEEMNAKPPEPGDYLAASWWRRVLILLAGPGMNYVTALFLVTMLFLIKGEIIPMEKPVLGFVPPGSLAEKAGLQKGDVLLKANGKDISNLQTADDLYPDYGKSVDVLAERKGKTFAATLTRPAKNLNEWESSKNAGLRFLSALGFGPDAPADPTFGISGFVPSVVGMAAMGNPARNAGIQDGDEITSINGHKVTEWSEMTYYIRNSQADPLQIEFKRGDKIHAVSIQRIFNGSNKAIGIMAPESKDPPEVKKVSLIQALNDSAKFSLNKSSEMLGGIWKMVTGKISLKDNIGGPVTIMRLMYHQATQGWEDFLSLVAVISLMLCLMNLLPLGVVDGGQIVICFIEAIKRRPMSVKFQTVYQQMGFVLIAGLMLFAVFNDFKNIFLEIHNHIQ